MKITNNEIVVELPEYAEVHDEYCGFLAGGRCDCGHECRNYTITETYNLNKPIVVDVAALATLIGDSDYSYDGNSEKLAQHLASNLDKWLIEKKEDRTDEQ